eukprot:5825510-Lingulodinium_polyedra.AAC.1
MAGCGSTAFSSARGSSRAHRAPSFLASWKVAFLWCRSRRRSSKASSSRPSRPSSRKRSSVRVNP